MGCNGFLRQETRMQVVWDCAEGLHEPHAGEDCVSMYSFSARVFCAALQRDRAGVWSRPGIGTGLEVQQRGDNMRAPCFSPSLWGRLPRSPCPKARSRRLMSGIRWMSSQRVRPFGLVPDENDTGGPFHRTPLLFFLVAASIARALLASWRRQYDGVIDSRG